ncbi:MAG: hypothetical protein MUO77_15165 [Anaerolineales bacterium]|nr:hypothetical protein [Anaerolineales bacterium]
MNFDFGDVLTRAWQITWKYKILWVFGILASCGRGGGNGGGGNSGGGRSSGSGDGSGFDPNNLFASDTFPRDIFQQAGQWLNDNWWIIALIILAVILLILLFYYLGTIGKIALIKGTFKAEQGVESMSFGELWSESQPYFWRVFGLSFLIGLAFLVILLPIIAIGILSAGVGLICLLPLICVLVPIAWVINVILEQADAAIVLEDKSMFDGFKRGWEVAKNNVGPMIVMALILMIGGAIIGIIIALPILIIVVPVAVGAAAIGSLGDISNLSTPLIIGAACCILYFPVLLTLNGVLTTYIQSAWTLTFMRLTKPQDNAPVFITGNAQ